MQHSRKFMSLLSGTIMCVYTAGSSMAAEQSSVAKSVSIIGVVDRERVVSGYPKAQQAAEEVKRGEERIHKLMEDSNKQYDEVRAAKKPPAELEGLQKRLQNQIDDEYKRFQTRVQQMESELEASLDASVKAEAASRKVDLVFLKQAVLVGGVDLTEGVIKRLSAVASASKPASK